MARPERNNVDYFPFLCKEGKAMFYIEQKYGNDGYAVWVKILRQLAVTNFHYLNLSDQAEFMFLSSKCRVSELMLENIINDLCKLGEFHAELWLEYRILFNEKFVESIEDAYAKRNSKCMSLQGLFSLLLDLGIRKPILNGKKLDSNPHSREDKSKEEKKESTHPLCLWIQRELPNVSKMKFQLTDQEADRLIKKIDKTIIRDILENMENKPSLAKNYSSVNRTIQSWANLRKQKNPTEQIEPKAKPDYSEQADFYGDLQAPNLKVFR